ncbi:uncharacterized protein C6orf118-like [Leucoraja erinacea]|uniref:uncharacterized protein C6orf118-like n=1 Tax=Leucoraja erinaceus TaxID=7782 RepID=UPI0024538F19|nr:uncharacterized protein C6orf118-like [Leucoraja erinacea]
MNSTKCSDPHKTTLRQLLHDLEKGQKADICAYTFGHLNQRNLSKVSGQYKGAVSWQGAKITTHRKEKSTSIQQLSKMKVKKMTEAMVELSLMTTVLPNLPAANLPILCDLDQSAARGSREIPDTTSSTCTLITDAKKQSLQDHCIKEELDFTALMLMKPQPQKCEGPSGSQYQRQFIESYLAGVTKEDQFRKLLDFERKVLMKQDLLERDIMSGYKVAQKHEWKLANELMKLGHCPGPNLRRLQIFSEVFEDICQDTTTFRNILREIKVEYDAYLASLLEVQPMNEHKNLQAELQVMENRPVKTHHVEEVRQRILNLEQETKRDLQRNDEIRDELERELSKPKQQEVQPVAKPVEAKEHRLSITEKVLFLRSKIFQITEQIQEVEKELKQSMVPSTVTNALQSSLRDSQGEISNLQHSNAFLRRKITGFENYINIALNENKVSRSVKENFWKLVNDLVDSAENGVISG